jgi:hypothetical protein
MQDRYGRDRDRRPNSQPHGAATHGDTIYSRNGVTVTRERRPHPQALGALTVLRYVVHVNRQRALLNDGSDSTPNETEALRFASQLAYGRG